MAKAQGIGGTWALLLSTVGLMAMASCGGDVEGGQKPVAGLDSAGTGHSGGGKAMPVRPGQSDPGQPTPGTMTPGQTNPGGLGGLGYGGSLGDFPCIQPLTSGGTGFCEVEPDPVAGAGGQPPCRDLGSVASCEAAGCIAVTGTEYRLIGEGGVSGNGTGNECRTHEGVFVSCEEGYGGAAISDGCSLDCRACIVGGWSIRSATRWQGNCEFFSCEDGYVVDGSGGNPSN